MREDPLRKRHAPHSLAAVAGTPQQGADASGAPAPDAAADAAPRPTASPPASSRPRRRLTLLDRLIGCRIIDGPATWLVARVFFPLSRLWAASEEAGTDVDAFAAAAPVKRPHVIRGRFRRHLRRVLTRIEMARRRSRAADRAWEAAVFAHVPPPEAERFALEQARAAAARALVLQRGRLVWTLLRAGAGAVRYILPEEAELEAAYGVAQPDPARVYALPLPLPAVARSHGMPGRAGRDYWIRFPAPSTRVSGDAWARVREPVGVPDPPTFLFANGIAAEFDQLDAPPKELVALVDRGFRVIEMEAPFHGRRRNRGEYSGEPYFGRLPLGAIDIFTTMAKELGIAAAWLRGQGAGPVIFGGVSMGAFVAQLAAHHAQRWPAAAQPDALFLIVTVDRVSELPFTSRLAKLLHMPAAAAAAGLTPADAARWAGLVDVPETPPLDPGRIIGVLGRRDRICPFGRGAAQMQNWRVPAENLFVFPGGHFSTPFAMLNDGRALDRLAAVAGGGVLHGQGAGLYSPA